jgi:hypothetical protein
MLINVNFGGFYESLHDYYVEESIASYFGYYLEDGEVDQEQMWHIGFDIWKWVKIEYSKEYVNELNYMLDTRIKFVELDSPSMYNYRTDVIIANISRKDRLAIMEYIREEGLKEQVLKHIKISSTSYDGYISFLNYEDYFKKENTNFLIEIMLDVIIKNSEIVLEEFRIVNMPEVIKDIKCPSYYTLKGEDDVL